MRNRVRAGAGGSLAAPAGSGAGPTTWRRAGRTGAPAPDRGTVAVAAPLAPGAPPDTAAGTAAATPAAAGAPTGRAAVALLVLLGTLTAIGPLSLDTYLPALPAMAANLHADASEIQLSLTTCLIGLALGQLVGGSLSDRWGRRRPALVGVAAYALLALACAVAPNAGVLAAIRLAQGFAGGTGVVVARAIVRDLYAGRAAARYFSRLTLVFGVAPVAAPTLGGLVLRLGSWRAVFLTLAGIGLLLAAAAVWRLPETLPPNRRSTGGLVDLVRTMRSLLADRVYLGYTLTQALAFAGLFAYISGSSFVFQDVFGIPAGLFALIFGMNALGLVAVGQLNARLLDRAGPRRLLMITLVVATAAATVLLLGATAGSVAAVAVALFVFVGSLGMVAPNSTALALDRGAGRAGSAAALMGMIQSVIGAAVAPLVGLGGTASALPMAAGVFAAAALSLAAVLTLTRGDTTATG